MPHHRTLTMAQPEPEGFNLGKTLAEGFAWSVVYVTFAFFALFVL